MPRTVFVCCVLMLFGCGEEQVQVERTDEVLVAEVLSEPATKPAAEAYRDCILRTTKVTPNGHSAMDTDRIARVLKACGSQEAAMTSAIALRWPEASEQAEAERRERGMRAVATNLIRANPFEPPSVVID